MKIIFNYCLMNWKKILVITSLFSGIIFSNAFCQYYNSAVGIRLGNASGITGKLLLGNNTYAEGMFTARWDGFNITALLEITQPFPDTPGLGWYYGLGANLGFWNEPNDQENDTDLFIGADAMLGMEYTFEDVPINISIDWKPFFNIITNPDFVFDEFAMSVRYAIPGR